MVGGRSLREQVARAQRWFGQQTGSPVQAELPPLQFQLLTLDQLARHARDLTAHHQIDRRARNNLLLARLNDNALSIDDSYRVLLASASRQRRLTAAGEWLLDNFYLLEEQAALVARHLPRSFNRELPRLVAGPFRGLPRVYALAVEVITHVDGRFDEASIESFIGAYQEHSVLGLGELWAFPIMLRMALIEVVRRVAERVAAARLDRDRAHVWAERFRLTADTKPGHLVLVLAELVQSEVGLSDAFVSEFTRRIQASGQAQSMVGDWLDQRLALRGGSIVLAIASDDQAQVDYQMSISNAIGSLRELAATDWRLFVERQSVVERILNEDPADCHRQMDFATRDRYRHQVELIARRARREEADIASMVVRCAGAATAHSPGRHVGWWLVGNGRRQLWRQAGAQPSLGDLGLQWLAAWPVGWYLGTSLLLAGLAVLVIKDQLGLAGGLAGLALTLLAGAAAWGPALTCVDWLVTTLVPPRQLPRLDLRHGIGSQHRTAVAVPVMLTSATEVEASLSNLEVRSLANRDPELRFVLLSDLADAMDEHLPGDRALIEQAVRGIAELNRRHGPQYLLLHRPRRFNVQENRWMGRERKRGKLEDLNHAILHGDVAAFSVVAGSPAILTGVRYVIVLDADTQLPHGTACALVGAMAHPLNTPVFDARRGRVVAGYGLIQPRVGSSMPASRRSWLARLGSGDAGINPYTQAVSDVYQDLFGEGSYIGKGIYDVAMFDQVLRGRFPDNRILSHDLLEGSYLRCAYDSETVVFEDQPARLLADSMRRHRWTRGDWQIARWLLPSPPNATGYEPNPLTALSRWKIADNLRRSLAPALWLLLLMAAAMLPAGATLFAWALGMLALPALLPWAYAALRPADHLGLRAHVHRVVYGGLRTVALLLIELALLPYTAVNQLDAVRSALWRLSISKQQLLEWTTASAAELRVRGGLYLAWRALLASSLVVLALAIQAISLNPGGWPWYGPVLLLWLAAPLVVWVVSITRDDGHGVMSPATRVQLRRLALRTWRFFIVHVGERTNWLPPDNLQVDTVPVIARRTSPTNIGLTLLANLGARDFGLLSLGAMVMRCRSTLDTMDRLERYRGHLYNWYDTSTLLPLPPAYVSTVDSGNLMGHLLVLISGLGELPGQPVVPAALGDTLIELAELLTADGTGDEAHRVVALARSTAAGAGDLPTLHAGLVHLGRVVRQYRLDHPESEDWAITLAELCEDLAPELLALAPWISLPVPAPAALLAFPAAFRGLWQGLPTVGAIAALGPLVTADTTGWPDEFASAVAAGARHAQGLLVAAETLAMRCGSYARPELQFLFDSRRKLFTIGYHAAERRSDPSCYDLLASEARLVSYVAVATGAVDPDHWFALSRSVTEVSGRTCLVSWSGSMFEYLMPALVMPTCTGTLLDETGRAVVRAQIAYGRQRGVPWGMSESGYSFTDQEGTYQYRAFGVPGMGLKRGLSEDLVVAPYATVLSAMIEPEAAAANLRQLDQLGAAGTFGYYEAVDFTPMRLPPGQGHVVVKQYMVHHQGMAFLSLVQVLLDRPMQRRFLGDPELKAAELLLHERVPDLGTPLHPHEHESERLSREHGDAGSLRVLTDPCPAVPEIHLLSNGRYHVMVTAGGSGYSRCRSLAVTRWREDPTVEVHGFFCYLRDCDTGVWWSTTYQPGRRLARQNEAIFTLAKAEFRRREQGIDSHVEVAVSPDDDLEVRRVHLTNLSRRPRTIELTTFAEIVIAPQRADEAHPAFSNLFVRTEGLDDGAALLATRRARTPGEHPPWLLHLVQVHGRVDATVSFTTDRRAFLGRGRSLGDPQAMQLSGDLDREAGHVLDPALAIRRRVVIAPDETVVVDLVLGLCADRGAALALVEKHRDRRVVDRVFAASWTHAAILLARLGLSAQAALLIDRLAGAVLLPTGHRRSPAALIARNRRGQAGLWGLGISGDLPIVVVRCLDGEHLDLARALVQAHAWWASRGVAADLVLLAEHPTTYRQELRDALVAMVASGGAAASLDRPAGICVRRADQLMEEDRVLLLSAAVAVFQDGLGTLAEQVERIDRVKATIARRPMAGVAARAAGRDRQRPDLILGNGIGGFTRDGREYVMLLRPGMVTPAPWSNVIANPHFGTLVTESGGGYTWLENSHEFRLTPWYNEPVTDRSGQALYVRDDDSGESWSPTPAPRRGAGTYEVRHGFGYTIFEHEAAELATELSVYVASDAPVCFQVLRLRNASRRSRRVTLLGCFELVLGEHRDRTQLHVVTGYDAGVGTLTARNSFHPDMSERIAFLEVSAPRRTYSADRAEFIGVGRDLADPAALTQSILSGRTGGGLDPCFSFMAPFELEPGGHCEVVVMLGAARDHEDLVALVRRFRGAAAARQALEGVWSMWNRTTGTVQVATPDPSFDVMMNGWLVYQTLSARVWGRTGYYQSGGAYGFRDQLQDVMALVHAEPAVARQHLLLAARHQFREGDVQHWWHPPSGRGVRTRFSDDLLWLPLAVARYVEVTADTGVLAERCRFLDGRSVAHDEEAYYDLPLLADEEATLYVHCVRAIQRAGRVGVHGLPLMGCGDWNDGMNLVGNGGAGESVWLGWFLCDVLTRFLPLARLREDAPTVALCEKNLLQLRQALEREAWDGDWYLRAWFDDGRPLGSRSSPECSIDALPQSWAVLSGVGDPARCRTAMAAVGQRLVRPASGLVALFDPPFDQSDLEPGYIKGYPPGVRENGGQYTHAAVWTAMAYAALGDRGKAWEVLDLINPVHHGDNPARMARYRVEPYVLAADVYGVAPLVGRGGWSWYTGAAGWCYRLGLESLLGVERVGTNLRITPRPRPGWTSYQVTYRHGTAAYIITVEGDGAEFATSVDGAALADGLVPLHDDGQEHQVAVQLRREHPGTSPSTSP